MYLNKTFLVLIFVGLLSSFSVIGQELKITDGLCFLDVLSLEKGQKIAVKSGKFQGPVNDFSALALKLAIEHYQNTDTWRFSSSNQKIYIDTHSAIFENKNDVNRKLFIGNIITLSMHSDEDLITYYYIADQLNAPRLKMYFHSEQSATASWPCQY